MDIRIEMAVIFTTNPLFIMATCNPMEMRIRLIVIKNKIISLTMVVVARALVQMADRHILARLGMGKVLKNSFLYFSVFILNYIVYVVF